MSSLVSKLFYPVKGTIPIIHPTFKQLGRLWIPLQFVKGTSGLENFYAGHPQAPALCPQSREGSCPNEKNCSLIHIDKAYCTLIEEALLAQDVSNCCRHHGDPASTHPSNPSGGLFSLSELHSVEVRVEGNGSYAPFKVPPDRCVLRLLPQFPRWC